ncbi:MAG TPA: hypothetical protein VGC12_00275 [Methyloradius sp.]
MYYVLVDIGCIECGEESHVIGIFTHRVVAEGALKFNTEAQQNDWHGEHHFKIFEIGEIDKEYIFYS